MMNTRYYVEIGQPVDRIVELHSPADVHALLWACARHRPFLTAFCERDDREALSNEGLRGRPLPGPGQYDHFRERVGYWEAALDFDDAEDRLGSAVIAALNSYSSLMLENPLAGKPDRFTSIVEEAARHWADGQQDEPTYEIR
ncbi:MAG: hypothetical protein HKN82_15895 [Akkermansiaceae bacterium]|nr:hypothetical protein [Akkermansiaceae bacterium]